jgi:L-seryl-tRNA(Ser) seleniumtransferase
MPTPQDLLRNLPAVDRVLREEQLQALSGSLPQEALTGAVQQVIAQLRQELRTDPAGFRAMELQPDRVAGRVAELCRSWLQPSLRKVINASGTLLHTNLGRAPLAPAALRALHEVASGYSNLELDLESGQRGERFSHVEQLLRLLTGAEAALVVNNNAGAVLLALSALGKGREAIVSRGELVEIGGAFRIPEVMEAGGVILREVGASNRTHLRDYRQAIGERTALLLKVHTSNYRIVGFASEVPARELLPLAREHGLILMEDLGSGMLCDLTAWGLPAEPTVAETVAAGVDVITFSGDKLLGGPQAGIILGRKELVRKIGRHPLARALRIDKLTLAALEATLRLYLQPEQARNRIPVLRMLAATQPQQLRRCRRLLEELQQAGVAAELELVEDRARVGGGAMPLAELPDWAVAVAPRGCSAEVLARTLRRARPAVVGRVQNDRLLLNLRAVTPQEQGVLARILSELLQERA